MTLSNKMLPKIITYLILHSFTFSPVCIWGDSSLEGADIDNLLQLIFGTEEDFNGHRTH